jgi:hypothetical protein
MVQTLRGPTQIGNVEYGFDQTNFHWTTHMYAVQFKDVYHRFRGPEQSSPDPREIQLWIYVMVLHRPPATVPMRERRWKMEQHLVSMD